MERRTYSLLGPDGLVYQSAIKGALGGHRRSKVYGRLNCPGAARALARGGPYARFRVFFADETTAVAAGYRPCWLCMRGEYETWKQKSRTGVTTVAHTDLP
jgi:methylphosphotriester-DNA--protein-cysteine methyltransferase